MVRSGWFESSPAFIFRGLFSLLHCSSILLMKRQSHSSESSTASFVAADSHAEQLIERAPASLKRRVSPPPTRKRTVTAKEEVSTAAVEAGQVSVEDHVAFFSQKLLSARLPEVQDRPQLGHDDWLQLYQRNLNDEGHHFVVHQHDHPVAGTHYDLRLQCNATSSISFAIMYGLPGDPNSRRLNRNAAETRVHNLWNHLIETASHETGTMLIWDTGEYEVLPYYSEKVTGKHKGSDDSDSDSSATKNPDTAFANMSEPEKLAYCFARRKIRLRLHGTRLPNGYTVGIRLTLDNDRAIQPKPPNFKRKRKSRQQDTIPNSGSQQNSTSSESSEASSSTTTHQIRQRPRRTVSSLHRTASPPRKNPSFNNSTTKSDPPALSVSNLTSTSTYHRNETTNTTTSDPTSENESTNETIRLTNAYPGATNSISSIHQRKWYLSLSRTLSGFISIPTPENIRHHARTYWIRNAPKETGHGKGKGIAKLTKGNGNGNDDGNGTTVRSGFEPFYVLGRDVERSVVTGRLARDVLVDEGVEGYVPRGKWRGVVE